MKTSPRTAKSIAKVAAGYKLKPFQFPVDMVILIDTREQTPLFGPRLPKGMNLCTTTLRDGDYSLRGFEQQFCIERKGINDLISYCTTERDKTQAKMKRFRQMEWVGLIIEARESEVYRPYFYSSVSPELIRQCLVSFNIRFGVNVYIGDRESIQRWAVDHMIKYFKIKKEL